MVAFHGVEEEPVMWRLLGSMLTKVYTYPAFQSDHDQHFVDQIADMKVNYYSKYMTYKGHADFHKKHMDNYCSPALPLLGLLTAVPCLYHTVKYSKHLNTQQAYRKGYDILNEANEKWKAIIGARKTKSMITGKQVLCHCSDKCNGGTDFEFNTPNTVECLEKDLNSACFSCTPRVYSIVETIVTQKANDGVVLAESATMLPGAVVNPGLSFRDYQLEKTNHQQLRNCSKTAEKLNRLFNTDDYSSFFITDVR